MSNSDADDAYFARREALHRDLASRARESQIARIHETLADAYKLKARAARIRARDAAPAFTVGDASDNPLDQTAYAYESPKVEAQGRS